MAGSRDKEPRAEEFARLQAQNAELTVRLTEMEDTLRAIQSGDVDALVVNDDIFVLESAGAASTRLRQDVLSQMQDAVFAFDTEGHLIYLNAAAESHYGLVSADVLGRSRQHLFAESDIRSIEGAGVHAAANATASSFQATHALPSGKAMHVEVRTSALLDAEGETFGSLAVVRDVTARRHAEQRSNAVAQLNERLRDLEDLGEIYAQAAQTLGTALGVGRVAFGAFDAEAETIALEPHWTSPGIQVLSGSFQLRTYGSFVDDLKRNAIVAIEDVDRDPRTQSSAAKLKALSVLSLVNVPLLSQGRLTRVMCVNHDDVREWHASDLQFLRDAAERTQTFADKVGNAIALRQSESRLRTANEGLEAAVQERTRELMTAQQELRQAQKMEAVGQLTGGIAHDFNNLLGGMSASLQVLQTRLQQGRLEGVERYLSLSQEAIKRAAALTQRLLAFARRQTLDPKPTDVNKLILGLEEMIQRTVGPGVAVEVVGSASLWPTRIDPSQLENSIINLCINARDAMPEGGRLTIETANKWLDDRSAAERDLVAGQYVALCVSDTGCGMPADVIERIFDPFYTTKPIGQGTGLGLSMVYGFVRQSGGQIRVYSEVGKGTTMCLYLPRHWGSSVEEDAQESVPMEANGAGEKILVIDDEATIRVLIAEVLQEAGYSVITAEDGPAGLRALQTAGRVDLLVTDVGLPGGLNGRQVADAARVTLPDLQVLFITGYAENAMVRNGLISPGMQVLTKPFDLNALALKVREMMDAPLSR